jgi:hypothetical protein
MQVSYSLPSRPWKTRLAAMALSAGMLGCLSTVQAQVHTTWLWHLEQPTYWPEVSPSNPFRYQMARESHDLKFSGGNIYSDGLAHPLNDLEEIFSKADRVAVYQHRAKESLQTLLGYPKAGVQVNYSGDLIENVNSLADFNRWGYYPSWKSNYVTARNWTTSGGKPRMDMTGFSMHHALSPLVSDQVLRRQIQAHKVAYAANFGTTPPYSKGYWPAECSFSERNIKVLVEEGFEWSVVASAHIARTLSDYPLSFGTNVCNYDPPNQADITPLTGNNWWNGQIDGRGGAFAAPMCYLPHYVRYVDPATGGEYKMIAVPMDDLLSYKDGYSPMGTTDIDNHIAPYQLPGRPNLVLLAHDGDNAYGGGFSYYMEDVPNFAAAASGRGYVPTTIEQYLADYPVPSTDIIHVEDGSWVNAANDWGSPQFLNWMWPQFNPATHEFDPNGWTEDVRNWAVLTAAENYVQMAEDLSPPINMNRVVYPGPSSTNAELAWHFLLPAYNSGYMYYGASIDMEVKPSLGGNRAISYANMVIDANPGVDNTPPSVFIPQRYPYNPGGTGFGPNYGYTPFANPSDFTVWTMAYDVNGLSTVELAYRLDADGSNPLNNDDNETSAGGPGVGPWQYLPMAERIMPVDNITGNPEINFFILPDAIANQYYAKIEGLSETLVDYCVRVTDMNGNVTMTPIQHVYVGASTPVGGGGPGGSYNVSWEPVNPGPDDVITITVEDAGQAADLHWGLTVGGVKFTRPISAYRPAGTTLWPSSGAVETPFVGPDEDGNLVLQIGPFNNAAQEASHVDFVIHFANDTWDNNSGADYRITIGDGAGPGGVPLGVSWTPTAPNAGQTITVTVGGATQGANIHWGVRSGGSNWQNPIAAYRPAGSFLFNGTGPAVETPMSGPDADGVLSVVLGPFNNPSQVVQALNFVIHYDNDTWNNNGGADYFVAVSPEPVACTAPTGLSSTVLGPTTAQVSWNPVSGADQIILQGRRATGGGARQIVLPGSASGRLLNGLLAGTTYQWRLQAVCGAVSSPFTAIQNFSTPASRQDDVRMDTWPNPTSDVLYVQLRGANNDQVPLMLYSADGRVVQEIFSDASGAATFNLGHLAAGLYLMRAGGDYNAVRSVVLE